MTRISITVDGVGYDDDVEPRTLLVHHLRERLGKEGTVVGCDTSNCGACPVLMSGEGVQSPAVPALHAEGPGNNPTQGPLGSHGGLRPLQELVHLPHTLQC